MQIVLNKRASADAWLASVKGSLEFYASTTYLVIGYWDPYLYWHHQIYNAIAHLLARRFDIHRRELFSTKTYEMHNDWVRGLARQYDRPLLEYDVKDGWKPLCEYLGVLAPLDKVSGEHISFPRVNDSGEMQELKQYLIWKGLKVWTRVLAPVMLVCVGLGCALFVVR